MKKLRVFLILSIVLCLTRSVQAQSIPTCTFEADGSIVCTVGGGGGGGEDGGDPGSEPVACTPGATHQETLYRPETSLGAGQCSVWENRVEDCTHVILFGTSMGVADCPQQVIVPPHPCTRFSVGNGSITCEALDWNLSARVRFPEIFLDVRPYPATLVRWPTAVRNGGMPESTGSGTRNYLPLGGGSPDQPREGDWRNLRLTLTLRPAGSLLVTLPYVRDLRLPVQGDSGTPTLFEWEVPSHPSVGANLLAGSVSGLEELPGDMPLFTGNGRAPYKLYWELRYFVYTAITECVAGPGDNGRYNCNSGRGHRVVVGYRWRLNASGGEIPPYAVQGLPASAAADTNGDGVLDAYWDRNLTLRRMDDNNRVDNPQYQRSWNWGGMIYWAVREGQGQIGWPGQ